MSWPVAEHRREATLDRYLREQASQDVKRLVASCFVAVETATNRIAGYYTLAATSVPANDLPTEVLKRLPRYPILPAALVGRLAVDQSFHRKGLGSTLLADAALRVLKGDTKAFALIVEADMRELDLGKPLALDFARQFLPGDFDDVRQFQKGRLRQIQGSVGSKGRARSMVRFRGESRGKSLEDVVRS